MAHSHTELGKSAQVKRAQQREGRTVANIAFHSIQREAGLVGLHGIFSYSGLLWMRLRAASVFSQHRTGSTKKNDCRLLFLLSFYTVSVHLRISSSTCLSAVFSDKSKNIRGRTQEQVDTCWQPLKYNCKPYKSGLNLYSESMSLKINYEYFIFLICL